MTVRRRPDHRPRARAPRPRPPPLAIDAEPATEALTYSILEEDEDRDVWRIDAFPTTDDEQAALRRHPGRLPGAARGHREAGRRRLAGHGALRPAAGARRPLLRLWRARPGPGAAQRGEPAHRGRRGLRHRPPRHHGRLPAGLRPPAEAPAVRAACWTSAAAPACWPSPRRGPASQVALGTDIDAPSVRIANENAR